MSGPYRTYRGIVGEAIRVPADTIAPPLGLHSVGHRYPFAELAGTLGDARDDFAVLVARVPMFDEAVQHRRVRSMLDREGRRSPASR